jgi:hypothetical protein
VIGENKGDRAFVQVAKETSIFKSLLVSVFERCVENSSRLKRFFYSIEYGTPIPASNMKQRSASPDPIEFTVEGDFKDGSSGPMGGATRMPPMARFIS